MYDALIDEYLAKVTRDMSPRQKREVENELRTHILDSAEALAAERKTAIDEAIVREVIGNMAPASKLGDLYPTPGALLQLKRVRQLVKGLSVFGAMFLLLAGILWLVAPDALGTLPATIILSVLGAFVVLFLILTLAFTTAYFYETMSGAPRKAMQKNLKKGLAREHTPVKVFAVVFFTLAWLAIICLFWQAIPFPSRLGSGVEIIPLLSADFARFVPWFFLLGVLTIVEQLLYLFVRQDWVPSLVAAVLAAGNALLNLWLLSAFPFNPGLSSGIQSGIKVLLAVVIMLALISTAVRLWKTTRLFLASVTAERPRDGIS